MRAENLNLFDLRTKERFDALGIAIKALVNEGTLLDRVLEIIDEIERDAGHVAIIGSDDKFAGVHCNSRELRDRVLALKGGQG